MGDFGSEAGWSKTKSVLLSETATELAEVRVQLAVVERERESIIQSCKDIAEEREMFRAESDEARADYNRLRDEYHRLEGRLADESRAHQRAAAERDEVRGIIANADSACESLSDEDATFIRAALAGITMKGNDAANTNAV